MRTNILLCLGLLLSLAVSYEMDGDVIVLTDQDDFPAVIKQFPYLLIEFYAPWCGHCKKLAPAYTAAATALKEASSPIRLAKVDATVQKNIARLHSVRGYPTLYFYVNEGKVKFGGSRSKDGIIDWVNKKIIPTVVELNEESYNKLKEEQKGVSVVLFSSDAQKKKQLGHLALADEYNKYYVAPWGDRDGEVQLIRDFDEEITFKQSWNDLGNWISFEGRPRLVPFDQRTSNSVFGDMKKALVFINAKDEGSDQIHETFQEIAKQSNGEIIHAQLVKGTDNYDKIVGFMKFDLKKSRVIIIEFGRKKKFVLPGQLNKANIQQFLNKYRQGKAQTYEMNADEKYIDKQQNTNPTSNSSAGQL